MWCRACGAPRSSLGGVCADCGRPWAPAPRGSRCTATAAGEPCEAGRGLGGFRFREIPARAPLAGSTPAGLAARGEQTLFRVRAAGMAAVDLAYVRWEDGEREIKLLAPPDGEPDGPARLEVEAWGDGWLSMDLDHAPPAGVDGAPGRPVSEYELDAAAHACVRCALLVVGARAMGTRQEVLGVGDERRHHLCTTFPRRARLVPAVVFALTRLAPALHASRARGA